ncbi:MAG TPA: DUF4129 domain-containing protein [Oscillatoriales cyanobacterium M59_W2019_021]|nr:DUF4129 domain-containing protein [Oscillatoriales cyanobacterium M4454_W2019_049]HIK49686.1 DUF4129 domain-containing protein [Oscillatoriales cyanobacterium M59_W2019_021]
MSAGKFETTNLGWRFQQWQQQTGEWIELKLSQLFPESLPNVPDNSNNFPSWDFSWVVRGIGILLLAGMVGLLGRWLWQWLSGVRLRTIDRRSPSPETQKLAVKAWLERSRQQQQKGNYRVACRCLYMAMLQQLDDAKIVPDRPSLTDGEYDRLLQENPKNSAYKVLLETHERLYFGRRKATAQTFDRCQQAYREIEGKS